MPKCDFIEIALRQDCSPVNLVHVFRTSFPKKTSEAIKSDFEAASEAIKSQRRIQNPVKNPRYIF